jgi:hypothetical protein
MAMVTIPVINVAMLSSMIWRAAAAADLVENFRAEKTRLALCQIFLALVSSLIDHKSFFGSLQNIFAPPLLVQ